MRWSSVREDLSIDNIDTCVGFAVSKNRRCRHPTPSAQKYWARASLERISENGIQWQQLTHGHFDEYLFDELAQLLLCSRHHREQKRSIIAGWKQRALSRERERVSQEVRALETTVETITTMIESVSLAVQQHIPEPFSSSTGVSEREASVNLPESHTFDTPRPNAASSSNRHSTTPRGHDPGSISLTSSYHNLIWPYSYTPGSTYSNSRYGSNLIWPPVRNAHLHQRASLSIRHSTSPTPAAIMRDSTDSKQPQPLEEVEMLCPICLDSLEDTRTLRNCRSCVQKFHMYCISKWLDYNIDQNRYGTCPCW